MDTLQRAFSSPSALTSVSHPSEAEALPHTSSVKDFKSRKGHEHTLVRSQSASAQLFSPALPRKAKTAPLLPVHLRTPEREPVRLSESTEGMTITPQKNATPTKPGWNDDFVDKPSEGFEKVMRDRKTRATSSPSTPHASRVSGDVNQLRGTSKRQTTPKPGSNGSVVSNLRSTVTVPSPVSKLSHAHQKLPQRFTGGGLTRTPNGTCFRVPPPVNKTTGKTRPPNSFEAKLRESIAHSKKDQNSDVFMNDITVNSNSGDTHQEYDHDRMLKRIRELEVALAEEKLAHTRTREASAKREAALLENVREGKEIRRHLEQELAFLNNEKESSLDSLGQRLENAHISVQ